MIFTKVVTRASLLFCLLTTSVHAFSTAPTVQLATTYQSKANISDYWISEKLDGIRGFWNGTSLLTRNGNIIHAPVWFTEFWPNKAIDGELWLARNRFEQTSSCVLKKIPNTCWQEIRFMIFDLPTHGGAFSHRIDAMKSLTNHSPSKYLMMIPQTKLANEKSLYALLNQVVNNHGEGLMLHHQNAYYQQGRRQQLMKLKKHQDAEAKVIGHIAGKGKYKNMLGSLMVATPDGLTFKLGSGFSDQQRKNPPAVGSTVTYKYLGKTQRGIPRFASFMRIRTTE